ncbi:hypothetical protein Tco_0304309, partial [Tanacetum coccineum]
MEKDEDKDPEEDEFEEEEDPQEEEDDMEVNIEEDENEPELTYPYEEVDPLNSRRLLLSQNLRMRSSDGLLPGLMRRDINSLFGRMASLLIRLCGREMAYVLVKKKGKAKDEYYGKLILDLGNEVHSSVEQGTSAMEKLVEKLGNAEDKAESERARQANVRNDASGSGPVRGQDTAHAVRECTFFRFMKCNPAVFRGVKGAVELRRWFEKTESVFEISKCAEGKKVKFDATTLEGPFLT